MRQAYIKDVFTISIVLLFQYFDKGKLVKLYKMIDCQVYRKVSSYFVNNNEVQNKSGKSKFLCIRGLLLNCIDL